MQRASDRCRIDGQLIGHRMLIPAFDIDEPEHLLLAEAKGRVMIYDGMPIDVVDRAMDEQFDRIDHMMFTRIRHPAPEGEEVEDDGC